MANKQYTHRQLVELRVSLPYGSLKFVAHSLGYKNAQSLNYLFDNPQNIDENLYNEIKQLGESWTSSTQLGTKLIAEYDHEQQEFYYSKLNEFVNSKEFSSLSTTKKQRVISEHNAISKQIKSNSPF